MKLSFTAVIASMLLLLSGCLEDEVLSNQADILSFLFPAISVSATINGTLITADVPWNTDMVMEPLIEASPGATVNPGSGLPRNFSDTLSYSVLAEDQLTTQVYRVAINMLDPTYIEITAFDVTEATNVTIDNIARTIVLDVPAGTDVTALLPVITATPDGLTISPASEVARDFSNPVEYTLTGGNLSVIYTVSVNFLP